MRAILLADDLVFRRGDEACFHRNAGPDGRSDCASRFCLERTHSLLLMQHLGRNLITVFSTVNTPCEKSSRSAPSCACPERGARVAHAMSAPAHRLWPARLPGNETSFFKYFLRGPQRRSRFRRLPRIDAHRCASASERKKSDLRRSRRIFAPHKPVCAKVRELKPAIRRLEAVRAGSLSRSRSAIGAHFNADGVAGESQRETNKKAARGMRAASSEAAVGARGGAIRISGRLLPTVRRSRRDRAVR